MLAKQTRNIYAAVAGVLLVALAVILSSFGPSCEPEEPEVLRPYPAFDASPAAPEESGFTLPDTGGKRA